APLRELAAAAEVPVQVVDWDSSWQLLSADALVSALATEGAEQVAARWTDRSDLPRPGVFLDVLYDPWPAPLARVVTALGGEVADGLEMLAHQADMQVRSMLGVESAPVGQMLAAARQAVSDRPWPAAASRQRPGSDCVTGPNVLVRQGKAVVKSRACADAPPSLAPDHEEVTHDPA